MTQESENCAPGASSTPQAYCKGCGYALVGLQSSTCPECGRGFDLLNRRTFARRPPRSWVWRWGRRVLALVLLFALAAGAGVGWLWWGWHSEQKTIAQLHGSIMTMKMKPIGPERLRWVLGARLAYLTDRVNVLKVGSPIPTGIQQVDFRSLTHVQRLSLFESELSGSSLATLAGLGRLEQLSLLGLRTENADFAFLEKLPALRTLELRGAWVDKPTLACVSHLGRLKVLIIQNAGIDDSDLRELQGLHSLEELYLDGNEITDAGLEHLRGLASLQTLVIDFSPANSSGVAKLKKEILGLNVFGF